ncbi:hypothetical protein LBMAG18_12720 [Alphaproteobacteria bacterium]|nr:hypothetical protein LBMAG18_12720 [Alphaproteobacteria bacterium]
MPKNFLKQIRERKNVSQVDLANSVGVTKGHISKFEKGDFSVSFKVLSKIAEILEVTVEEIISGQPIQNFDENHRLLLEQCVEIASNDFGNELEKKDILRIATTMFSIILQYRQNPENGESQQIFIKKTQDKMFEGLASKSILKNSEIFFKNSNQ